MSVSVHELATGSLACPADSDLTDQSQTETARGEQSLFNTSTGSARTTQRYVHAIPCGSLLEALGSQPAASGPLTEIPKVTRSGPKVRATYAKRQLSPCGQVSPRAMCGHFRILCLFLRRSLISTEIGSCENVHLSPRLQPSAERW